MDTPRSRSNSVDSKTRTSSSPKNKTIRKTPVASNSTSKKEKAWMPKPSRGHPTQNPKPELRAELLADFLKKEGADERIVNISEIVPGNLYYVVTGPTNKQRAYYLKVESIDGKRVVFYKRDFRNAGFGVSGSAVVITGIQNIYKRTPALDTKLSAEGGWIIDDEWTR